MIRVSIDASGLDRAMRLFEASLEVHLRGGLVMTLESIAARAKQTSMFVDRTGALRQSIQSDGVTGSLDDAGGLVGVVSYAATSERGAFYGAFLEYGTRYIKERRFIRDAIAAEDGSLLEEAIGGAFQSAGFEVG